MDHRLHHDRLVARAQERVITGYTERHHVIPRCLGGTNDRSNIVRLTPEEHFLIHLLLMKMHPGHIGLMSAAFLMAKSGGGTQRSNKLYGWLRRKYAIARTGVAYGVTSETRAKLSAALKGRMITSEHREKIAITLRNMAVSDGKKPGKKRTKAVGKREFTDQEIERIKHLNLGKALPLETRDKMRRAATGRTHDPKTKARIAAKMRDVWRMRREPTASCAST